MNISSTIEPPRSNFDDPCILPSPADRPDADVVIFDGKCKFCRTQVEKLYRWDSKHRLSFVSLHDPFVAENYPDLTRDQLMAQLYVVSSDGKRSGGASAFRYLSRRLPRLWLLAPLLHVPFSLPIWQWGYDRIARRRYKISESLGDECDNGTCGIHFDK